MAMLKLKEQGWWVLVAVIMVVVCWLTHGQYAHWGDDYALYLQQARAIEDGNIRQLVERQHFLLAHTAADVSPLVYPWGVPLLQRTAMNLVPAPLAAGWCLNTLGQIVAMLAALAKLQKPLGKSLALALAILVLAHPALAYSRMDASSDSLALSISLLLVFAWYRPLPVPARRLVVWAGAGGLLLGVAITLRLTLVCLLPWAAWQLWRQGRLAGVNTWRLWGVWGLALLLVALPVYTLLPWPLYTKTFSYTTWGQPLAWWGRQLLFWLQTMRQEFWAHSQLPWLWIPALPLLAVGWYRAGGYLKALAGVAMLQLWVVVASPYPPYLRYCLLLIPLVMWLVALGALQLSKWPKHYWRRLAPPIITMAAWVSALGLLWASAKHTRHQDRLLASYGPQSKGFMEAIETIKAEEAQRPVCFAKPRLLYAHLPNPLFNGTIDSLMQWPPNTLLLAAKDNPLLQSLTPNEKALLAAAAYKAKWQNAYFEIYEQR